MRLPLLFLLIFHTTAVFAPPDPVRPPDPTQSDTPAYTARLTTGDGALTVYHPDGWVTLADENQLTFASSDQVLYSPYPFNLQNDSDFRAGVFVLEQDLSNGDEAVTLQMLMDSYIELATGREVFTFDTPQSVELTGRRALIVSGESAVADQVFITVSLGDGYYAAVLFFTAPGSGKAFADIAQAIAGNMEYFPESSPSERLFEALLPRHT
jgi:hypothetical protein